MSLATQPRELVSLRDLCIVHGRGPNATVAVEGLDLTIGHNEFVCIIGPSGCGKSTLLKAVAGLLPSECVQGDITIEGATPEEARKANKFAFVFQEPVLAPWRTALQNVKLPLEVAGRRNRPTGARSPEELLELVGLDGFGNRLPAQLSGGMKQRVSIARALTLQPSVLLMDEPFGALDELTRDKMHEELLNIWGATDTSILLVTHSIIEAVFMADRVVVMSPRPGRLTATIDVTFDRPRRHELKKQIDFLDKVNEVRTALEEAK